MWLVANGRLGLSVLFELQAEVENEPPPQAMAYVLLGSSGDMGAPQREGKL